MGSKPARQRQGAPATPRQTPRGSRAGGVLQRWRLALPCRVFGRPALTAPARGPGGGVNARPDIHVQVCASDLAVNERSQRSVDEIAAPDSVCGCVSRLTKDQHRRGDSGTPYTALQKRSSAQTTGPARLRLSPEAQCSASICSTSISGAATARLNDDCDRSSSATLRRAATSEIA